MQAEFRRRLIRPECLDRRTVRDVRERSGPGGPETARLLRRSSSAAMTCPSTTSSTLAAPATESITCRCRAGVRRVRYRAAVADRNLHDGTDTARRDYRRRRGVQRCAFVHVPTSRTYPSTVSRSRLRGDALAFGSFAQFRDDEANGRTSFGDEWDRARVTGPRSLGEHASHGGGHDVLDLFQRRSVGDGADGIGNSVRVSGPMAGTEMFGTGLQGQRNPPGIAESALRKRGRGDLWQSRRPEKSTTRSDAIIGVNSEGGF